MLLILILPLPPSSTLFPTRRSSDLAASTSSRSTWSSSARAAPWTRPRRGRPSRRSEEHTSELQSLRHLVCRLLLEKKKKRQKQPRRVQRAPRITVAYIGTCSNIARI